MITGIYFGTNVRKINNGDFDTEKLNNNNNCAKGEILCLTEDNTFLFLVIIYYY
jgi:hypothetical protein